MSKHTEGPWRERVGAEWLGIEAVKNDVLIAEMYDNSTLSKQEIIANAHLIAAAPELLEACKRVRDEWLSASIPTRLKRILDDAIAKAEGRA